MTPKGMAMLLAGLATAIVGIRVFGDGMIRTKRQSTYIQANRSVRNATIA